MTRRLKLSKQSETLKVLKSTNHHLMISQMKH